MNPEETKNLRWNYTANILDGAFFGLGIGFASFSTVIPLFVDRMTNSAMLIGLISAVHVMGFQLPQLFMARSVSRLTRYKPMVVLLTIHERVPFLGLALIALFYKQLGTQAAIILTFLMLLWQGFGAGFTANAWQNMIVKVIPSDYLARFFGLQSSAANLLASLAAIGAGIILDRQSFPNNFALCFLLAFGILMLSFVAIAVTRESPHESYFSTREQPPLWHSIREIVKSDPNFNWFLGRAHPGPIWHHGVFFLYRLCRQSSDGRRLHRRGIDQYPDGYTGRHQPAAWMVSRSLEPQRGIGNRRGGDISERNYRSLRAQYRPGCTR